MKKITELVNENETSPAKIGLLGMVLFYFARKIEPSPFLLWYLEKPVYSTKKIDRKEVAV